MSRNFKTLLLVSLASVIFLFVLIGSNFVLRNSAASSTLSISPTSGIVGSTITVKGDGFPPNMNLTLNWGTANVSWVLGGNPIQVTGINATPIQEGLTKFQTNASGSFSVIVSAPVDNGGKHVIQMYTTNGTALGNPTIFSLEPSFVVSPSSGAAGTPLLVIAHGLGDGTYSTNYHVMWDNKYFGYMTAVTTHGEANFTFYAVGTLGIHYVDIYQGYPGPGYLNPSQNPSPGNWYPPYLPYQTTFNITSDPFATSANNLGSASNSSMTFLAVSSLSLVICAFVLVPILAFRGRNGGRRIWPTRGLGKVATIAIILGLLIAAGVIFIVYLDLSGTNQGTKTSLANYVPQEVVVRPQITVPQTIGISGPRISVSPNVATVGSLVNVTGSGFPSDSPIPVSWSSRQGNNLNGFVIVNRPLENVITNDLGSFSFTMKVPSDLEGNHFISVANLTQNSNATLYIERNATIMPDKGPQGTQIKIQLLGTGWDFNTNIVVIDYDNAFVGYACGFNSQGNITVVIPAAGSPGVHTIDLYPSIYLGPAPPSTIPVYRYPLLTPDDHPEKVPSFHFSFLITSQNGTIQSVSTTNGSGASSVIDFLFPAVLSLLSIGIGVSSVLPRVPRVLTRKNL